MTKFTFAAASPKKDLGKPGNLHMLLNYHVLRNLQLSLRLCAGKACSSLPWSSQSVQNAGKAWSRLHSVCSEPLCSVHVFAQVPRSMQYNISYTSIYKYAKVYAYYPNLTEPQNYLQFLRNID